MVESECVIVLVVCCECMLYLIIIFFGIVQKDLFF